MVKDNIIDNDHIISNYINKWQISKIYSDQYILNDIEMLTKLQLTIISQLRTEHIKLNKCMHMLQHYPYYKNQIKSDGKLWKYIKCEDDCCISNNSGFCAHCYNKIEDVYHFIMECKMFKNNVLNYI